MFIGQGLSLDARHAAQAERRAANAAVVAPPAAERPLSAAPPPPAPLCRAQEWHTNSIDGVINPAEYIVWQFLQARHPCDIALVIVVPPILLAVLLYLVPKVSKLW